MLRSRRTTREKLPRSPVRTLANLFDIYQKELPAGAKEERTLERERLHIQHLLRHLKGSTIVETLTTAAIQKYVETRSRDKFRGRFVGPDTIQKEISTFRLIWNWAVKQGYLRSPAPVDKLVFPKRNEKPPFMTFPEITRIIERGDVSPKEEEELWECLFLTRPV